MSCSASRNLPTISRRVSSCEQSIMRSKFWRSRDGCCIDLDFTGFSTVFDCGFIGLCEACLRLRYFALFLHDSEQYFCRLPCPDGWNSLPQTSQITFPPLSPIIVVHPFGYHGEKSALCGGAGSARGLGFLPLGGSDADGFEWHRAWFDGWFAGGVAFRPFVRTVAFGLVAASVRELGVVPCERVAAAADRDDLVHLGAHRMRCLKGFVDGFAADGARVVCGEDPRPELRAFPAVGFSWVWFVSAHVSR